MFCPNCGNDCKGARFCSVCGTELLQKKSEDSYIQRDSYAIPKGSFKAYGGYIKLEEKAFVIRNQFALGCAIRIPYQQLIQVLYVRPGKNLLANGFLIVRWEGNRNKPIPKGYARRSEKSAVVFSRLQDPFFYHIYCLLKTLAPQTAVFQMEHPKSNIPEVDRWGKNEDIDAYFEEYNPNRERAVTALCRDSGVNVPTATAIINRGFDARQQLLYDKEPIAAIRDLNRVIMKNAYVDYTYSQR